jgi:hypothetical protein
MSVTVARRKIKKQALGKELYCDLGEPLRDYFNIGPNTTTVIYNAAVACFISASSCRGIHFLDLIL